MESTINDQGEKGDTGNRGKGGVIFVFVLIYLLSAGVLAYGAYQYGLYRGGDPVNLRPNLLGKGERGGGVPTEVVNKTDKTITLTPTPPKVSPTPSTGSTTLTTSPLRASPTTSNLINYQYQLPSGWQVVQATDASFEMGFEPSTSKADVNTIGEIRVIKVIGGSLVTQVKIVNYSGTDKKSFILNTAGISLTEQNKTANYKEVEFSIDWRSCFFLEGLNIPNYGVVLGMCDAGGGKAFFVNSWSLDYVQVVRSLKRLR